MKMTYHDDLKVAKNNFKFIKDKFKIITIGFETVQEIEEAENWIKHNTNQLAITQFWWNRLSNSLNDDPSISEICEEIRRIMEEENEKVLFRTFFFLDDGDMVLFKLRFL